MDSNPQTETTTEQVPEAMNFNSESSGSMVSPSADADQDIFASLKEMAAPFASTLGELPDFIGKFFAEYQQQLLVVGVIVGSLIAVKLTLALVDAVNEIPLLSPFFELVGLTYSVWFVYRYLLKASTRDELVNEVNSFKSQILGGKKS